MCKFTSHKVIDVQYMFAIIAITQNMKSTDSLTLRPPFAQPYACARLLCLPAKGGPGVEKVPVLRVLLVVVVVLATLSLKPFCCSKLLLINGVNNGFDGTDGDEMC